MRCFVNKAGGWLGGTFHWCLIMQSAILRCSEQMYTETLELLLCRYSLHLHNRGRCFVTTLKESRCAVKAPVTCLLIAGPGPGPGPGTGPGPFCLLWERKPSSVVPRGSPSVSEVNDAWTAGTLLSVNHMVMCKGSPLFREGTGWGCWCQTPKYRGARAN